MPGWPAESTLTDLRVSKIFSACVDSGKLTESNLLAIKKTLSKKKNAQNWPCVASIWDGEVTLAELKPTEPRPPMRIPQPKTIRAAVVRGFRKGRNSPLLYWMVMYLAFWDGFVCGARPNVDLGKLKRSNEHYWDWELGWCCTAMENGRSKLCGIKRGSRPWSSWLTCMCKGEHTKVPALVWSYFDEDGNLSKDFGLDFSCPVVCQQLIFQWLRAHNQRLRKYPNFLPRSKRNSKRRFAAVGPLWLQECL